MIGIASHVMIEVPTASHVTPPSTIVAPAEVGHTGCVCPELAGFACTASNRKLLIAVGCSKLHVTKSAKPVLREFVPLPAPIATRTCAALAGATPVTEDLR